MSWIGGLNDSFNQITSKAGQIGGQLSSFTKEVLSESTDEVTDYESEVKALRLKLIETESAVSEYEAQTAEQKQRISLLQDQCRKSELEAHTCARQYEAKFQKQSKLLDRLKQEKSVGNEEDFQIISKRDGGFSSKRTFSGGSQDAAEYADIIHCQQEINRLSEEMEKVQEERDKWKNLAQFPQDSSSHGDVTSHAKIKELEERLHEALNRHQHEYIALQESNAVSTRQLQEENRKLRLHVAGQGGGEVGSGGHSGDDLHTYKQEIVKLSNENQELNEKLRTRSRQLQVQKKSIDDLRAELEECNETEKKLKLEVQKNATQCEEIKNEKLKFQAESDKKTKVLRQFIEGIATCIPEHAEDINQSSSYQSAMNHVKQLRESHDRYHEELVKLREEMDGDRKEKNLAESDQWNIESSENSFVQSSDNECHQVNEKNEDELQPHKPVHFSQPLYQSSPQLHPQPHQVASDENFFIVPPDLAEKDLPEADLTLTLQALQKQVEDYEVEIAQYELVQKEWQDEKQSLQAVLERYQSERSDNTPASNQSPADTTDRAFVVSQLKKEISELQSVRVNMEKDKIKLIQEKEHLQNAALNLQEELNVSINEAQAERDHFVALKGDLENALQEKKKLETVLKNITDELNSSRMDKAELDEAIETLDAQHQDEMAQLLKIRADLTRQNKSYEEKIELIQDQNKSLVSKNQELMESVKSQDTGIDSELTRVREDFAALVDDKRGLEEEVESLQGKLSDSERKLMDAEDAMLNAETAAEELKEKLLTSEKDKIRLEDELAALEQENQASIAKLQEQVHGYAEQLEASKLKVSGFEEQRNKMEVERKTTILKMEELTTEHQKVIELIDTLQEDQRKSEEKHLYSVRRKDEQLASLQSQLDDLEEQNKQRLDELTKHGDNEAASSFQLSSFKNELLQLHERLQSSISERDSLKNKIQDIEQASKLLEKDLESKATEILSLLKQLDAAKNEAVMKVQETIEKHDLKSAELMEKYKTKLLEVESNHQMEIEKLKENFTNKTEQVLSEHEDSLKVLLEERESLKHQNSLLEERVEFMEQDVGNEVKILQEKHDKSEADHFKNADELTVINERLSKELNRERSLVENLEEELKKQLEIHHDRNNRNQAELNQLHSTVLNEKSILKSSFDEEKESLKEKHAAEVAEMKQDFNDHIKKLGDAHAEEILKTVSELNDSHKAKCKSLEERLLQVQRERASTEEDLRKAQDDLVTLSDHYEQEEAKWKKDASSLTEKLKQTHRDEISKLKSENEDLLQRMVNQNVNSIGNELVDSQLADLQNVEASLRKEVDQLNAIKKEQLETHREELTKNVKEIASLNKQLSELKEKNKTLQSENNILQQETNKTTSTNLSGNASNSEYEATITSLESELANLKLSSVKVVAGKQGSSTSGQQVDIHQMLREIRMRDLDELEKADLSKEDISTLLSLIKERDHVIKVLSAEVQAKESVNDHEVQLKRLNEEKEQILNVISEKTKENRTLKEELHQMMDVIAAGKSALSKVQEENQALVAKYGGLDQGMTKEAVARLSKLVSEKDLEIEALKQKCQTLLDVLHQQEARQASSPEGNTSTEPASISAQQLQGLLKDRETLSQQIRQLLTERDHLVALVNSKHQEAVLFQEEARKAAESLERDAAENSRLQVSYNNLVHDYEQLEIRQASVQKQLSGFKEALNHLEESKEIFLAKLDIESPSTSSASPSNRSINEVMENLRSDASKSSSGKSKEELQSIMEKNTEALLQKDLLLQENMDKSSQREKEMTQLKIDSREKDILIHKKMEEKTQLSNDLAQRTNEVNILRKSVENLREQISNSTHEAEGLRKRLETVERSSSEKDSESQAFQETNAQLSVMLKEREYELETLREKVGNLNDILQRNEQGKDHESQKYLKEVDRAKEQTTIAKHERDQIMLTLKQKQIETQRACEEARQLRDKGSKLQSELTRLRSHLVQVEETYTQEAVLSEEREQTLRIRLEQIQNKTASAVEANELSKQQMESLQEQVRSATQQRDQAIHNLQLAKEQSTQYATALHQLQMAAERMQREEAATYNARVEKINQHYQTKVNECEQLAKEVIELKAKLNEASVALESASRLNEQLELKEQTIEKLKQLVSEKQLQLEELQDELHKLNAKSDNMVDRQLVKNLLIGYFSTPPAKQPDVVRLISSMIGFTKEEEAKLHPEKKVWVSGWLPWGRGGPTSPGGRDGQSHSSPQNDNLNESFTGMFVKFLEDESAKRPVVKLPAAAMVSSAQQRMNQRKLAAEGIPTPAFNPPRTESSGGSPPARFAVAGRYNPFLATSSAASAPTGNASSHPLMQPLGSMFPTFAPLTSVKPSSERDLLQGILQPDAASSPS